MGSGKGNAKRINASNSLHEIQREHNYASASVIDWKEFITENDVADIDLTKYYIGKSLDLTANNKNPISDKVIIFLIEELIKDFIDTKTIEFEFPIDYTNVVIEKIEFSEKTKDYSVIAYYIKGHNNKELTVGYFLFEKGMKMRNIDYDHVSAAIQALRNLSLEI